MSGEPFFVVGSPRSGTTLVRRLLCAHPRIHVPGETGFLPFLRVDPERVLSRRQAERLLRRLVALNRYWAPSVRELGPPAADRTAAEVLATLYARRAAAHGAARWGDKTPGYVRYLPFLDRLFPGCLVVHVLRDGRDVALSARAMWGADHWYMDLRYLLRQWALNVECGRRDGAALGSHRYLEVRYDELVAEPLEVMSGILEFLGEPMDPHVGEIAGSAAPVPGERFHPSVARPVSQASVGRWRRELRPHEARLADSLVGDLLAELGYPLADLGPATAAERLARIPSALRYAVAGPLRRLLYAAGVLTLNRGLRSARWPLGRRSPP